MNRFLAAATWHGSLDDASALLAAHPEIAASGIHAAAVPWRRARSLID